MSRFYQDTNSEDESMENQPGERGSRFENDFIEQEEIGKGNFGSVVKVVNRLDGIEYAIKITQKSSHKSKP